MGSDDFGGGGGGHEGDLSMTLDDAVLIARYRSRQAQRRAWRDEGGGDGSEGSEGGRAAGGRGSKSDAPISADGMSSLHGRFVCLGVCFVLFAHRVFLKLTNVLSLFLYQKPIMQSLLF